MSNNIERALSAITRRLATLERSPRLPFTSLREGTFTVLDGAGIPRVKLGLLSDGVTYGIEIISGGVVVTNGGLTAAASAKGDQVATAQARTANTYADLTTAGPTVIVTVGDSGSLAVSVGCLIDGFHSTAAAMSFALSGANTLAAADNHAALMELNGGAAAARLSMSKMVVLEGLNPGATTVTSKYRSDNVTSTSFADRSLLAIPL